MTTQYERERKSPRLRRSLTFVTTEGWRGQVVDLSISGLKMKSLGVLPPQTEVDGVLEVDGEPPVALRGVVRWSSPPVRDDEGLASLGLELSEVPDGYLQLLARLFADQK